MNNNFLKNFITETIYIIPEETMAESRDEHMTVNEAQNIVDNKTQESIQKEIVFDIRGSFDHDLLILLDDERDKYIQQEDEVFLTKVLQAVNIDIQKTALLNLSTNQHFDADQLNRFKSSYVLYFTDSNKILSSSFVTYTPTKVDHKQILLASALKKISSDVNEKKLLWAALKQMF